MGRPILLPFRPMQSLKRPSAASKRAPLTNPPEIRLTQSDVAKRWGLSEKTLEHWRARRYGPKWLALSRNCIRYRLEDVEEWEAAHICVPSPDRAVSS